MSTANFPSARAADAFGDDWPDHLFGPDNSIADNAAADDAAADQPAILAMPTVTIPLLARIPDVSQVPRPSHWSAEIASEPVRIDPPTVRPTIGRHTGADRARLCDVAASRQHSSIVRDVRSRPTPTKSRVLPKGNPFEIPRERLQDRFAPVVRFLLLFVLFTAAGTSLLMIGRSSEMPAAATKHSAAKTSAAVAVPTATEKPALTQRSLELMDLAELPVSNPPKSDTPKAIVRTDSPLAPRMELPPAAPPQTAREVKETPQGPPTEVNLGPYPSTNYSPAKLPKAGQGPFPRVQTTDAQQVTARAQQTQKLSPR